MEKFFWKKMETSGREVAEQCSETAPQWKKGVTNETKLVYKILHNREPVGFQKDRHTISEFLYLNRADTGSVAVLRHTIVSI
jgi:hypothetical protein